MVPTYRRGTTESGASRPQSQTIPLRDPDGSPERNCWLSASWSVCLFIRLIVEVRGVEPRSAEPFTSASPSAAISELSVRRGADGKSLVYLSGLIFTRRSRTPADASRIATPDTGEAGTHRADELLLSVTQAASAKLSSALIGWFRLFNGASGIPGSLPTLQHSTSNPVHPLGL